MALKQISLRPETRTSLDTIKARQKANAEAEGATVVAGNLEYEKDLSETWEVVVTKVTAPDPTKQSKKYTVSIDSVIGGRSSVAMAEPAPLGSKIKVCMAVYTVKSEDKKGKKTAQQAECLAIA